MSILLTKLLPMFVYPVGAGLLLGLLAFGFLVAKFRRTGLTILAITLTVLWISATPIAANFLLAQLESDHPSILPEGLPSADAIILLGGIIGQQSEPHAPENLGEAADRIMHALRLYRSGKSHYIVVTGGNLPWQVSAAPEASVIASLLIELGVPSSAIILETGSRNTRENAVNTAAIFSKRGWRTGLLVTSGLHMPRAFAAFEKAGIDVTAAATDIRANYLTTYSMLDFLPEANALLQTTLCIKEILGWIVYRTGNWL